MMLSLCLLCLLFAAADGTAAADDVARFHTYLAEVGAVHPHVICSDTTMGRGVVATREIAAHAPVIKVPIAAVMCRATILGEADPAIADLLQPLSDRHLVSAWLMLQRARGAASSWAPYIAVLPQSVPLPRAFSDKDLEAAQDPELKARNLRARADLEAQFADTVEPVLRASLAAASDAAEPLSDSLAVRRWHWATALVDSRALTIMGKKFMVPLADMFNYKAHPTPRLNDNGAFFLEHHVLSDARGATVSSNPERAAFFTVHADRATRSVRGRRLRASAGSTALQRLWSLTLRRLLSQH